MNSLLEIVKNIGNFEYALSILKALRAKIEHNYGFTNRIGRAFSDGFKGVLGIGQAGCGKTITLKRLFYGLELDKNDVRGNPIGVWIPSGISTGVGLFELLIQHNDSVIIIDELDANTTLHVNVLKQIASGSICRLKHQDINTTPFTGVLIGATNGIPFTKKNFNHLVAMLERFTVVYINSSSHNDYYVVDNYIQDNLSTDSWDIIIEAVTSRCNYDLSADEHAIGKQMFEEKACENLDSSKALYRQASDVMDILLFLKRFCNIKDITTNSEILDIAQQLIDVSVHVNPAKFLSMEPIERGIYNFIDSSENHSAVLSSVLDFCERNGYSIDPRSIRRILNKMIAVRILNKYAGDVFSTRHKSYNKTIGKINVLSRTL